MAYMECLGIDENKHISYKSLVTQQARLFEATSNKGIATSNNDKGIPTSNKGIATSSFLLLASSY